MGSKTRLSSYCTKRGDNTVKLVTSRKTNARLARPIGLTLLNDLLREREVTLSERHYENDNFILEKS